jgi:hypothetical protein
MGNGVAVKVSMGVKNRHGANGLNSQLLVYWWQRATMIIRNSDYFITGDVL